MADMGKQIFLIIGRRLRRKRDALISITRHNSYVYNVYGVCAVPNIQHPNDVFVEEKKNETL